MILSIKFSNGVDYRILNYQLDNNQLVVAWLTLFVRAKQSVDYNIHGSFFCKTSGDSISETYEQLKKYITELEITSRLKIKLPLDYNKLNRTTINKLTNLELHFFKSPRDQEHFKLIIDRLKFLLSYNKHRQGYTNLFDDCIFNGCCVYSCCGNTAKLSPEG
jgi:hypothetical protein